MLSKRIIPCLDIQDGQVVKGVNFQHVKAVADPIELAQFYNDSGADELVFYDISAAVEERQIFSELLQAVAKKIFIPLCVGGNIRTLEDITVVLGSGADKVSINSGALGCPQLINQAAQKYGNQCIVASVDVKRTAQGFEVFTSGGRKATGIDALEWMKELEQRGAGELVVNSIDTDGVRQGFDLPLLELVSKQVAIPIVASGGAGNSTHFRDLFMSNPQINAGLAASIFHFKEVLIPDLKEYLATEGIAVRRNGYDTV